MRPVQGDRDSNRDSGRRRKTLSAEADAALWKAYRYEHYARLQRQDYQTRVDLFSHFDTARRLRQDAIAALEKLRWIDERVFAVFGPRPAANGSIYTAQPVDEAINTINKLDAAEQDQELPARDRIGAADIGRPDELGAIGRAMARLIKQGESPSAIARHYETHASGKGGLPEIPFDVLLDRLKKRGKK